MSSPLSRTLNLHIRAANMNQPTENRPTFNTCNSSLAHTVSHVLQMINTAAHLVRAHLDFRKSCRPHTVLLTDKFLTDELVFFGITSTDFRLLIKLHI